MYMSIYFICIEWFYISGFLCQNNNVRDGNELITTLCLDEELYVLFKKIIVNIVDELIKSVESN